MMFLPGSSLRENQQETGAEMKVGVCPVCEQ